MLPWYMAWNDCAAKDGRIAAPKTWNEWKKIIPVASRNYWTGFLVT
jgi:hypothetical protein